MNSFTKDEIENQLQEELGNFKETIDALNDFCLVVEKHNHHPTFINDYNNLSVKTYTHDANGITQKDFDLAKAINELKL